MTLVVDQDVDTRGTYEVTKSSVQCPSSGLRVIVIACVLQAVDGDGNAVGEPFSPNDATVEYLGTSGATGYFVKGVACLLQNMGVFAGNMDIVFTTVEPVLPAVGYEVIGTVVYLKTDEPGLSCDEQVVQFFGPLADATGDGTPKYTGDLGLPTSASANAETQGSAWYSCIITEGVAGDPSTTRVIAVGSCNSTTMQFVWSDPAVQLRERLPLPHLNNIALLSSGDDSQPYADTAFDLTVPWTAADVADQVAVSVYHPSTANFTVTCIMRTSWNSP